MTRALALSAAVLAIACTDDGLVGQRCRIGGDADNPGQVIVASPSRLPVAHLPAPVGR